MASPDVLILGGGIIGLTAALELADAGATVSVYDRGELGQEASWAGAGIIPPWGPGPKATPLDELRALSVSRFAEYTQRLQNETGIECGYRVCGGYELFDKIDFEVLAMWQREQIVFSERGVLTSPERLPREVDTPCSEVRSYYLPAMAQVRNPWLLRAVIRACELRDIKLNPQTTVESWSFHTGRVAGIRMANGETRSAGRYILAAGAWAEQFLTSLVAAQSIRPVRGQMILFRAEQATLQHIVIVGKRYLVPRGDGLILAGSTEEPEAGFVKQTTDDGIAGLKQFALELLPALRNATVERFWAGLRPRSADGYPTISRVPGQDNVFAAIGHFRAGIQLSLGTAALVKDLILCQKTLLPPLPFAFDRPNQSANRPAFRS
ncbi:glycine oxidase ThiO [soil metagenome]